MKKIFPEDDDDELHDSPQEEIPPQKKISKKRKTSSSASSERNDVGSDDDLPEMLTMTEGKSMVQQRRNDEKASSRRIVEDARKRKKERTEKRKDSKKSSKTEVVSSVEPTTETIVPSKVTGLLDDSIVQFLNARERNKLENMNLESSIPVKKKEKRSSKNRRSAKDSRVQVIVLNKDSEKSAQNSAMKFKQEHLYGNRLKRDRCMLKRLG